MSGTKTQHTHTISKVSCLQVRHEGLFQSPVGQNLESLYVQAGDPVQEVQFSALLPMFWVTTTSPAPPRLSFSVHKQETRI